MVAKFSTANVIKRTMWLCLNQYFIQTFLGGFFL